MSKKIDLPKARPQKKTTNEDRIAYWFVRGYSPDVIAEKLGINLSVVRNAIRNNPDCQRRLRRRSQKIPDQVRDSALKDVKQGMPLHEAARKYGISYPYISVMCRMAGIRAPDPKAVHRDRVMAMAIPLWEERRSTVEIAQELGEDYGLIYRGLIAYGLQPHKKNPNATIRDNFVQLRVLAELLKNDGRNQRQLSNDMGQDEAVISRIKKKAIELGLLQVTPAQYRLGKGEEIK